MRWITDSSEFQDLTLEANEAVYTDSSRHPTTLRKLVFDDAEICTPGFFGLLQHLMGRAAVDRATYLVLRPDPVHYFYREFGKYPALEINRADQPEQYLRSMNEDPGDSPADAIGINWSECAIVCPANHWFVHALRDDRSEGGHLWLPNEWVADVVLRYPAARQEGQTRHMTT